MAINAQKFLPSGTSGGALAKVSKTIKKNSVVVSLSETSIKNVGIIRVKVIQIEDIMRGTLVSRKKNLDEKKRRDSGSRREKLESDLEKKSDIKKDDAKKTGLPKMGFLEWIKNFIGKTILGYFAIRMIDHLPKLMPFVKVLAGAADFIINVGGKLLNALVTFIDWGYKAYDATRGFMKNLFGENQAKQFDKFAGLLNQFLNLAIIVGMATAAGGGFGKPGKGPKGKPKVTQGRGGQKPTGRPRITGGTGPKWWENITSKLKGGPFAKLAGPLSKFAGAAIPFAGAAIGALDAKARFSRGEQLGGWMASISSALDAFAGSVAAAGLIAGATGIGIPVFAVLEAIAGVSTAISIGIDAVLLVSDIIKAFGGPSVPGMAGGGRAPVSRGGRAQGGPRRTIGSEKGKYKRSIPQKPGKVEITSPGADIGGKDKLFGIFPNPLAAAQKVVDAINPFKTVKDAGEELGKTDYFGPILAISAKITAGQKPSQQDYQNVGRGLNLLITKGIQDKQLKGGIVAAFAEGGLVDPDVLSAAETGGDITNWVAKTFQGEIESNAERTLRMIRENAEKKKYEEGTKEGEGENVGGTAGQFSPTGLQGDIYKYLLSKGMSDNHALGIMANIHRESGFRPGVSESGGPGVGLFQYSSDGRKSAFLKAVPDYATNWKGQIDFAIKEDVAPQYFKQNFSSAQDAADWWMRKWERPAEYIQNDKGPKIHAQYLAGLQKYKTQKGYEIPTSGSMQLGSGYGSAGSKIAGELGRFMKKNGVVTGSIHRHPEHPPYSLTSGHSRGSLHYQGRAIDLGGYANEQGPILAAVAEFNRLKGVKPVQLLHAGNEPSGHSDHVHVAYEKGGETLGYPHFAMLGEKGTEIVIDADSAGPAKNMLLAINQAKDYRGVMQAIQQYAPYDALAPQTIVVSALPTQESMEDYGDADGNFVSMSSSGETSNPMDILYKGG